METKLPNSNEIDHLISFLPRLYADPLLVLNTWHGDRKGDDEIGAFPYPVYADVVREFFRVASASCWCDGEYDPLTAGDMLRQPGFVESADLKKIKTVLTYCVRGERLCDGFWAARIEDGHIRRILERLAEIRATMP